MITEDQFIEKYKGKKLEAGGSANALNQCVDCANGYIDEVLGFPKILGTNAQDFPKKAGSNYDYILNTPNGVPTKGDLVIWKSKDGVGHIGIFFSGDANSFISFDENWPTNSPCSLVKHTYTNVLGWLHPKISNPPPLNMPSNDLQKVLIHFNVKTADELITTEDQQRQFLADERAKNDALNSTLIATTNEHKDFVSKIISLVNPFGNPAGLSDENLAIQGVTQLVSSNSQAQQTIKDQQKIADETALKVAEHEKELNTQIATLKKQAENLQLQLDNLQKGIGKVEQAQQTQQTQKAQISLFQAFITKLVNTFGGK